MLVGWPSRSNFARHHCIEQRTLSAIQVWECNVIADGRPITVRQVLERSYPRLKRFRSWHYHGARRALRKVAIVVACSRYSGRGPTIVVALIVGALGAFLSFKG
jgi:hypothetical protein